MKKQRVILKCSVWINISILVLLYFSFTQAKSWITTFQNRPIDQIFDVPNRGISFRCDTTIYGFNDSNGMTKWSIQLKRRYRYISPCSNGYIAANDFSGHVAVLKLDSTGKELWQKIYWGNEDVTRWGDRVFELKNGNIFCSYIYSPTGNREIGIFMTDPDGNNMVDNYRSTGYSTTAIVNQYNDTTVIASFVRDSSVVVLAYSIKGKLLFERVCSYPEVVPKISLSKKQEFSFIDKNRGSAVIMNKLMPYIYFNSENTINILRTGSIYSFHSDSLAPFIDTLSLFAPGNSKQLIPSGDSVFYVWSSYPSGTQKNTKLYVAKYSLNGTMLWSGSCVFSQMGDSFANTVISSGISDDKGGIYLCGSCKAGGVLIHVENGDILPNSSPNWNFSCEGGPDCPYVFHKAATFSASSIDTHYVFDKTQLLEGKGQLITRPEIDSAWLVLAYDYTVPFQRISFGYLNFDMYHNMDTTLNANIYISTDSKDWKLFGKTSVLPTFLDTVNLPNPIMGRYLRIVIKGLNGNYVWLQEVKAFSLSDEKSKIKFNLSNIEAFKKLPISFLYSNGQINGVELSMQKNENVSISIWELSGRKVCSLINSDLCAGLHHFELNTDNLHSGVYIINIKSGNSLLSQKLILRHK